MHSVRVLGGACPSESPPPLITTMSEHSLLLYFIVSYSYSLGERTILPLDCSHWAYHKPCFSLEEKFPLSSSFYLLPCFPSAGESFCRQCLHYVSPNECTTIKWTISPFWLFTVLHSQKSFWEKRFHTHSPPPALFDFLGISGIIGLKSMDFCMALNVSWIAYS